jgi:hypothetical protein
MLITIPSAKYRSGIARKDFKRLGSVMTGATVLASVGDCRLRLRAVQSPNIKP